MASQAKFLDFIDMIDGGGAGRMGDRFEGGGIFSALANLIATPYGSEDEGRRASREAFLRSRGLLDDPAVASAAPAAAPAMTGPTRAQRMSAAAAEMERQRGLAQDALDPRGPNQMGVPVAVPASSMQFGQQPAGALPSMSFGQQPVGSMPSMSFGQQPVGAMPAAPSGVTTQDMALADLQRRIDAVRQAGGTEEDMAPLLRLYSERIALLDPAMYGPNANEARLGTSAMNQVYDYLLPPTRLDGPMYKGFRP